MSNVPVYIYTHTPPPHLLYPLLCWWTSRLLPWLDYCKQCCSEHWGACVFVDYSFLQIYARSGIAGSYGSSTLCFLRNFHTVHSGVLIYIPTNSVGGFPFLYPFSSIDCRFFDDDPSDFCEVVPHSDVSKGVFRGACEVSISLGSLSADGWAVLPLAGCLAWGLSALEPAGC